MAPTREQMQAWQRQVAPGDGVGGWFDRGAWAATGQREPWLFNWSRALIFVAVTLGLLAALVVLGISDATVLIGGGIGVSLLTFRAHQLHRRFLQGRERT